MSKERAWRAYTIETPENLGHVLDAYRSRTGEHPVSAMISTRCKPEIAEAVREQFGKQVEQVSWLLPFDIWLTHEPAEEQLRQISMFPEGA